MRYVVIDGSLDEIEIHDSLGMYAPTALRGLKNNRYHRLYTAQESRCTSNNLNGKRLGTAVLFAHVFIARRLVAW